MRSKRVQKAAYKHEDQKTRNGDSIYGLHLRESCLSVVKKIWSHGILRSVQDEAGGSLNFRPSGSGGAARCTRGRVRSPILIPRSVGNSGRTPRGDSEKRGDALRFFLDEKSHAGNRAGMKPCRIIAGANASEQITEGEDVADAILEFITAGERWGGRCFLHGEKALDCPSQWTGSDKATRR